MENINTCPVCKIITYLDVCPDCNTILVGDDAGKDFHDVEDSKAKPSKKKEE